MTSTTPLLKLWCLFIHVDHSFDPGDPFYMMVKPGTDVDTLKGMIETKRPNETKGRRLAIWKLTTNLEIRDADSVNAALANVRLDPKSRKQIAGRELASFLLPLVEITESLLSNVGIDALHILVQLQGKDDTIEYLRLIVITDLTPSSSAHHDLFAAAGAEDADGRQAKRRRLSVNLSIDSWLLDWHSKLWRKGINHPIYRTATVTADDYKELCDLLQDISPHESDTIIQKKSNFLARLASRELPASPDDGNELIAQALTDTNTPAARTEILQDHFPIRIQYVDLTSLHISPRIPPLVILRDEYNIIDQIVERSPLPFRLISGTPGIGKTVYLYLRLIRNLIEGKPCFFQDETGTVFRIGHTIQCLPKRFDYSKDYSDIVEALVDADEVSSQPNVSLQGIHGLKMVVTSSPKPYRQRKWMKVNSIGYIMTNWDWEEILATALFLSPHKIALQQLHEATEVVGYNPRHCLLAASDPRNLKNMESEMRNAISDINSLDLLIGLLKKTAPADDGIPHRLFNVIPFDNDRLYPQHILDVKATWVIDFLEGRFFEHKTDEIRKFHDLIGNVPTAATFFGRIWEKRVHSFFERVGKPYHTTLTALDPAANDPSVQIILLPDPSRTEKFHGNNFGSILESSAYEKHACYVRPRSKTFPSIDAMIYNPTVSMDGFSKLLLLQMTTGISHNVKVKGLQAVQHALRLSSAELSSLRPTKSARKWALIFVIPDDKADQFIQGGLQKMDGNDSDCRIWESKTDQFVLRLKDDDLFG